MGKKLVDDEYISFVLTGDGSTGLFNHDVNDIYHSSYGAKTEAEEKFIAPLDFYKNFKHKNSINVLDICYGIGYNTKALLKNISDVKYKGKIKIDALEYDRSLVLLSPFIKDGYQDFYPYISLCLYKELYSQIYEERKLLSELIFRPVNKKYFTPFYRRLIKKYRNWGYITTLSVKINSFLHNIYYHCISLRNKCQLKYPKLCNFTFRPYFEDARKTILSLNEEYDIIFLDAFTPLKLPTLWSIDFFRELYRLSSYDGLLVTYSNSAAIRHAMLECGYYVGKIFDSSNRPSGTIASKNKNLITHPLDDYDLGLIKTNAGVYFEDENLNNTASEILLRHAERKKNLCLMSSSQYIKNFKKEHSDAQI